jgi:predicted aspartyl protease
VKSYFHCDLKSSPIAENSYLLCGHNSSPIAENPYVLRDQNSSHMYRNDISQNSRDELPHPDVHMVNESNVINACDPAVAEEVQMPSVNTVRKSLVQHRKSWRNPKLLLKKLKSKMRIVVEEESDLMSVMLPSSSHSVSHVEDQIKSRGMVETEQSLSPVVVNNMTNVDGDIVSLVEAAEAVSCSSSAGCSGDSKAVEETSSGESFSNVRRYVGKRVPTIMAKKSSKISNHEYARAQMGSLWINLAVNGSVVQFLLDTGSTVTLLKDSHGSEMRDSTVTLRTASGSMLDVDGEALVKIKVGRSSKMVNVIISRQVVDDTLGLDILGDLEAVIDLKNMCLTVQDDHIPLFTSKQVMAIALANSIPSSNSCPLPEIISSQICKLPSEFREEAAHMLNAYSELFRAEPLGRSKNFFHRIDLTDPAPIRQMARRTSPAQYAIIQEEIQKMLNLGVIRPSNSPYACPCVLVKKRDNTIRFCCDYRKLNEKTIGDAFPLPHIQDILDSLQGAKYFITLDLRSGFWQLGLRPEDIHKTAFVVPHGHYEWVTMPFGLMNASSSFQRAMSELLKPMLYKGVLVFIDDVTIYGETIQQLLARFREVLERIKGEGLTLNSKKCVLFQTEVDVMGHHVSGEGIMPLEDKVEAVCEWPEPKNKKEVRSFLGLASYYRTFIADFAKMAGPLHKLTSKKVQWQWGVTELHAFEDLKVALQQAPLLRLFDPKKPCIVDTDASAYAAGAILTQCDDEGNEHPVAYFSRCFSKTECNYCVTRRELLAILLALRRWRHYLMGGKIMVRTDHSALMWLKSLKNPEGQLARWLSELAQYDMEIRHRPGAKHQNSDDVSRRPCAATCKHCHRKEVREEELFVRTLQIQTSINWAEEQDKDVDITRVLQWKICGEKPQWEHVSGASPILKRLWQEFDILLIEGGVLKRMFYKPIGETKQVVVPRNLQSEILKMIHEQGHFGCLRTQIALKDRFYWPGWKTSVRKFVNACVPCNQQKGSHSRAKVPLKKYVSGNPLNDLGLMSVVLCL